MHFFSMYFFFVRAMLQHGTYKAADTVTYGLRMMNEIAVRNMQGVQKGFRKNTY